MKVPSDVVHAIDVYLEAAGRKDVVPDAPLYVGFDRGDHATAERISDKLLEHAGSQLGIHLSPHCLWASFITLTSEGEAQLDRCNTLRAMLIRTRPNAIESASLT